MGTEISPKNSIVEGLPGFVWAGWNKAALKMSEVKQVSKKAQELVYNKEKEAANPS